MVFATRCGVAVVRSSRAVGLLAGISARMTPQNSDLPLTLQPKHEQPQLPVDGLQRPLRSRAPARGVLRQRLQASRLRRLPDPIKGVELDDGRRVLQGVSGMVPRRFVELVASGGSRPAPGTALMESPASRWSSPRVATVRDRRRPRRWRASSLSIVAPSPLRRGSRRRAARRRGASVVARNACSRALRDSVGRAPGVAGRRRALLSAALQAARASSGLRCRMNGLTFRIRFVGAGATL